MFYGAWGCIFTNMPPSKHGFQAPLKHPEGIARPPAFTHLQLSASILPVYRGRSPCLQMWPLAHYPPLTLLGGGPHVWDAAPLSSRPHMYRQMGLASQTCFFCLSPKRKHVPRPKCSDNKSFFWAEVAFCLEQPLMGNISLISFQILLCSLLALHMIVRVKFALPLTGVFYIPKKQK